MVEHTSRLAPFVSLAELVDDLARVRADEPALRFAGRVETRGELAAQAQAVARGWAAAGFRPGDTVGVYGEGGPTFVSALLSAARAGLVPVLIDPRLTASEIAGVCDATRPRGFALCGYTEPPSVVFDRPVFAFEEGGCLRLRLAGRGEPLDQPGVEADRPAVMLVTSGTSGRPRVVALTARNLSSNICAGAEVHPCEPGDTFLSLLPATHAFELTTGLLGPLRASASIAFPDSRNPRGVLRTLSGGTVTHVNAVPALLRLVASELAESSNAPALVAGMRRTLRSIVCGGAPLARDLMDRLVALQLPLWVGYGLTEAAPVVASGRAACLPPGSTGRALPGIEIRINSQTAELLVRGPNVMPGYVNDPAATRAVLADGWLHTGDAARIDAEGHLFVLGRLRDLIVTSAGLKLSPDDVEQAYRSPLFAEVCVVGLPDEASGGGERPHLAVVPSPARAADEAALRDEFTRLSAAAGSRRCAGVTVLPAALPRTRTLKVRRDLVREAVLQAQEVLS